MDCQKEEQEFIEEFSNFVKEKLADKQINSLNESQDYLKSQMFAKKLMGRYRYFQIQKVSDF